MPGWPFVLLGLSFIAPEFSARLKLKLLRKFSKKDIVYLDDWKRSGIHIGFTTRHFPMVLHKTDELLGNSAQDQFVKLVHESSVNERFKIFSDKFVFLNQIHGDYVAVLDENQFSGGNFVHIPNADGVVTNLQNVTLLVFTADCLSIFLSGGRGDNQWIGIVHAGWRGTQKMIVKKAFDLIRQRSGCSASDVRAIFGPRIGTDHYEVGEEFVNYFGLSGSGRRSSLRRKNGKLYFDLAGENKKQLIEAGASKDRILNLHICTVSENHDFYSFRKEKEEAGRIISFISKF